MDKAEVNGEIREVGKPFGKEGFPFETHVIHENGVTSRSVLRAKRHDSKCFLGVVR